MRIPVILIILVALAGCTASEPAQPAADTNTTTIQKNQTPVNSTVEESGFQQIGNLTVSSPVFSDGGPIPDRYTCDSLDQHPQFIVQQIPEDTESIAMLVDDPDAGKEPFIHWIVWNLPPVNSFAAGASLGITGKNDFGNRGYNGPCPPEGEKHTYRFRAYALDTDLALPTTVTRDAFEAAMEGHLLGAAQTTATYQR